MQASTTDPGVGETGRPDKSRSVGRFESFTVAWALSSLVTSASFQEPKFAPAVAITSILMLIWPGSIPIFTALCALIAGRIMWRMPEGPNHYILELLVSFAFLAAAGVLYARKKVSGPSLMEKAAPTARLLLLLVYFFAVLDKSNTDYLSAHGCGWELVSPFFGGDALASRVPLMWQLGVYGSLATEAFLLLALSSTRFRKPALIIGACFHTFLAVVPYEGIASFSSLTLALYVLFMPEATNWREWAFLPKLQDWKMRAAAVVGGAAVWGLLSYKMSEKIAHATYPNLSSYGALRNEKDLASIVLSALIFVPMGAWLVSSLFRSMPSNVEASQPLRLWGPAWMAILPLLAVVNGLCPYIGLKTQTSFAMFSNLRTEQGRFNHLFLPASMQVFQYQKELIHVTKAPTAFTPSAEGVDVVPLEFRRRFARLHKGDEVTFTRDGVPGTLVKGERAATDKDLTKPLGFLQAKLLRFRPIISGP